MQSLSVDLPPGKKLYFASDFHLGLPGVPADEERERERFIARKLGEFAEDAAHIFLVGDLFDFWFEYGKAVPKGFSRFLGKLAELADAGLPVTVFVGNHDLWMFDYLEAEVGVRIYRDPLLVRSNGKSIYVHHGDGLGPGDRSYKALKKVFTNPLCQRAFRWLHPDLGIQLAMGWSADSKRRRPYSENVRMQEEGAVVKEEEWLWLHASAVEALTHHDYYVFGHRHLPLELPVGEGEQSVYVNLGDWVNFYTYGEFDGESLRLRWLDERPAS